MEHEGSLLHSQLTATLSLTWASSIQSMRPRRTSWRPILIVSSHLRLGLPSGLFSLRFPHQNPIRATCPAHLIVFDLITRTILGEEYRSLSSSLCSFLHSPVTSSHLGPNILLSTLLSNTLILRSSLNVSDIIYIYIYITHTYVHTKQQTKIIVLCIFIVIFLGSKLEDKRFCTEW